jgi:hypothetical protein
MIEITSEELIYKKDLVNQESMIFQNEKLDLFFGSLTPIGFQNLAIGWNIVYQKMLHFVYVVIS